MTSWRRWLDAGITTRGGVIDGIGGRAGDSSRTLRPTPIELFEPAVAGVDALAQASD